MSNVSFSWENDQKPSLKDLSIEVKKGQLVALVGSVGSGKTSLLCSLLGELVENNDKGGFVNVCGTLAYAAQVPWIQSATIMDNVTFGKELQKEEYDLVVDACALTKELDELASGSRTKIGKTE